MIDRLELIRRRLKYAETSARGARVPAYLYVADVSYLLSLLDRDVTPEHEGCHEEDVARMISEGCPHAD